MVRALRSLLLVYSGVALLGAGFLAAVIALFDPESGFWYQLAAFYFALFITGFGCAAILNVILRWLFGSHVTLFRDNGITARQSVFSALIIVAAFAFQSVRLLNPYTAVLLILSFGALELYFLTK